MEDFDEDETHTHAAVRGLIALGTELLQRASSQIEPVTDHPVHLYR